MKRYLWSLVNHSVLRSHSCQRLTYHSRFYQQSASPTAMPETKSTGPLVWVDCEMTGLHVERDSILSVACFITGPDLTLLDERGYEAVIHHNKEALDNMGDWCREHHGASGLTEAALRSSTSAEDAAAGLLGYIKQYVPEQRTGILAGNSIHADKGFLQKPPYSMVLDYLHYRILDVSSIKEAARRWSSEQLLENAPHKLKLHQARDDILESIEEARYYRQHLFLPRSDDKPGR